MIVFSDGYARSAQAAKHGGAGEFKVETILTPEQMGKAGRLFVRGTLESGAFRGACMPIRAIWRYATF